MPSKTKTLPPTTEVTKSRGTKRPAPEVTNSLPERPAAVPSKKPKLEETILRARDLLEEIRKKAQEEEAKEEEDDESDEEELTAADEVQGRLDHIDSMVSGLTKMYLKSIMKSLGIYGGGPNRYMMETIMESLRAEAEGGGDLVSEEKVCQRVYRECYGPGCDSDPEETYED